ncbi:Mucin-associated surface protein (MASP) [Trypanosoma cruzi]|uniref:Mucin-associated surface protein (MASP), putative n=2 Tax=Trypanosoma cruzi TaxID=5693 RepID=Q4E3X6_TRYCC|nr:mucin-associated surface protein (MASP), putative [Trypanosoma cruzi]EAN99468.1 mucin-associated surface protein (MASP), putative [Trypanosoma cruzi]PWV14409.1 Mucin-associated surface protein (MASP) [Trypanosoma cruzi]|eukprot:XP_821319.1 mucin-associated surface protein (MASP) [Trypanosoma cruzi strain CL Brener]
MAMTMAGRVLLVCALCVLWCVAGGVYARDVDTNALGGCMASGVLGENGSHMPDGCNETAITVPFRSALPITAVEASTGESVSDSTDIYPDSLSVPPSPPPVTGLPEALKAPKAPQDPPESDVGQTGVGNRLSLVPNDDSSGGGGFEENGNSNKSGVSASEFSTVVGASRSSIPPEVGGSENKSGAPPNLKLESPETNEPRERILVETNKDTQKVSKLEENPESSRKKEKANIRGTSEEAGKNEAGRSGVEAHGPSSVLSADGQLQHQGTTVTMTQPPPPSPEQQTSAVSPSPGVDTPAARSREAGDPEEGRGIPPARKASHNSTDEKHKAPPLRSEKESAAPKPPSADGVLEQNSEDTTTKEAIKMDAHTDGPAATSEQSTSASESGVVKRNESEDGDNAQRPEPKGQHNDPDAVNTKAAPTASEAASYTAKTVPAQKNDTVTYGDIDGGTAVSHTTSPLFSLVVVACAVAAAVVTA